MSMPPRFVVDAMLGSLARWLRIFGYDTRYADNAASDDEIARLAAEEGRVVVTRDRALAARTRSVLLGMDDDLDAQLAKVFAATGQGPQREALFTRCSLCNEPLREAGTQEIAQAVPEAVVQPDRSFKKCTNCGQVYWKGTHWDRIMDRFERLKHARP